MVSAASLVLAALLSAGAERASSVAEMPAPTEDVLSVDWARDAAITGLSLLALGVFEGGVKPAIKGAAHCTLLADGRCDPASLWRADRATVTRHNRAWRHVSDWAQISGIVLGAAAIGLDAALWRTPGRGPRVARGLLVYAETLALSAATSAALKVAVRRARPVNYRQPAKSSLEPQQSFPSGHTTAAAAATAGAVTLLSLSHTGAGFWATGIGAAVLLTGATASGRVLGGAHFLSDVLVGACIGTAFGIAVPSWHRRVPALTVSPLPQGALAQLSLSIF